MSFDHRAFAFEWNAFQRELVLLLAKALTGDDAKGLERFVDENLGACSNPNDGEALGVDWRNTLGAGDVQEIADIALTKFYDPSADGGLHELWSSVEEKLEPRARRALLGSPFEVRGVCFDPGKMGAYFQSPDEVTVSLATLRELDLSEGVELDEFAAFLATVAAESKGLYVTF